MKLIGGCIVAMLVLTATAACSGAGASPSATATKTVTATATVTATVTAKPTPDKPTSPRNLAIGSAWADREVRFHLLRYQANTTGYGAEPGQRWDAVLVKACVRDSARSRKGITFSWSPWSLTDKSSGLYPASSSTYTGFPSPEYPFADQSVFRPGDCAKGWIVFGVPDHVTITGVRYGNQMGETATWKVS